MTERVNIIGSDMSAHVIAITSSAGLPVFARKKGNSEAVSVKLSFVLKINLVISVALFNNRLAKWSSYVWKISKRGVAKLSYGRSQRCMEGI